jgi:hypothetical protein
MIEVIAIKLFDGTFDPLPLGISPAWHFSRLAPFKRAFVPD